MENNISIIALVKAQEVTRFTLVLEKRGEMNLSLGFGEVRCGIDNHADLDLRQALDIVKQVFEEADPNFNSSLYNPVNNVPLLMRAKSNSIGMGMLTWLDIPKGEEYGVPRNIGTTSGSGRCEYFQCPLRVFLQLVYGEFCNIPQKARYAFIREDGTRYEAGTIHEELYMPYTSIWIRPKMKYRAPADGHIYHGSWPGYGEEDPSCNPLHLTYFDAKILWHMQTAKEYPELPSEKAERENAYKEHKTEEAAWDSDSYGEVIAEGDDE